MIVTDASAWVTALTDSGRAGEVVRDRVASDQDWAAPAHCGLEVVRTLLKFERAGALTGEETTALVRRFGGLGVRYATVDADFLDDVWALRHNVSIYDAPYVALARSMEVPLLTVDLRLAAAAHQAGVRVWVPEEAA